MLLTVGKSQVGSVMEVLGMLVIFFAILALAYYATKYFGKLTSTGSHRGNIRVVETVRLAPEKYLQITKVGSKYFLIGVSKSHISLISELSEEDLRSGEEAGDEKQKETFKELLKKAMKK